MTEQEARAAGRDLAHSMSRYFLASSGATLVAGFGAGLMHGRGVPAWVGFVVAGAACVVLMVIAFAWRRFLRGAPAMPLDTRSAEEKMGAEVYGNAMGDLPISFTLSDQGRAELNRAAIRLGITRERAIAEAMGNFLRDHGRRAKR